MRGFVKVFRVEDEDGNGPYRGKVWQAGRDVPEGLQERFCDYAYRDRSLTKLQIISMTLWGHNWSDKHHSPLCDIETWRYIPNTQDYKFGFLLLSDLEEWFEDVKEAFGDILFVKEYWVEESTLLLGTSQVAFIAGTARSA